MKSLKNVSFVYESVTTYRGTTRGTGKSLSEALIFTEHGENMLCTQIALNVKINFFTQHILSLEFSRIELVIQ